MRVAVTGAAGFLGRSIVRRCSDQGDRVLACVSHRSGQEQELVRRAESIVRTDLAGSFDAAHFDGIDVVFHCAAQVKPAVRAHFLTGNVAVTRNVITAAAEAGVGCVIYFSSVAVHGEHQDHVGTDECGAFCSKPPSPYVESKITAELVAREIACQRNLRLVVLRPAWVWGPGDHALINVLAQLKQGWFPLIGDGANRLALAYIDNVVDVAMSASSMRASEPEAFIIHDDVPLSCAQFIKALAHTVGLSPRMIVLPKATWRAARFLASLFERLERVPPIPYYELAVLAHEQQFSTAKARRMLGFTPRIHLDEALRRTGEWLASL